VRRTLAQKVASSDHQQVYFCVESRARAKRHGLRLSMGTLYRMVLAERRLNCFWHSSSAKSNGSITEVLVPRNCYWPADVYGLMGHGGHADVGVTSPNGNSVSTTASSHVFVVKSTNGITDSVTTNFRSVSTSRCRKTECCIKQEVGDGALTSGESTWRVLKSGHAAVIISQPVFQSRCNHF
jgi:hypothetical protein